MELLNKHSMTMADIQYFQEIAYTYQKKVGDSVARSWIDHVCTSSDMKNITKVKICDDYLNMSDHNPIIIEYTLENGHRFTRICSKNKIKLKINWQDDNQVYEYTNRVEKELSKLNSDMEKIKNSVDKNDVRDQLTKLFKDIAFILIDSTKRTFNYYTKTKKKINWL